MKLIDLCRVQKEDICRDYLYCKANIYGKLVGDEAEIVFDMASWKLDIALNMNKHKTHCKYDWRDDCLGRSIFDILYKDWKCFRKNALDPKLYEWNNEGVKDIILEASKYE